MNEPQVTEELAREHGLSFAEYRRVLDRLGRTPTYVELGIISVMWSEHCSYKSSRSLLKTLPCEAPWVLVGPGENAGVIDVGEGLAVAFKMESHNHPSFIEPYQGAATGVGGILRDVFTMGARPVANMNSLRFGCLTNPRMRFLVSGVVAGIGGYGNCMGVPTVGGEVAFDPRYDGNILVNAFSLGVLRKDRIFKSAAAGVGSPVFYVGNKTGRDGIHGATMASEEFGTDSDAKRPRVQVGDPFSEKRLLEACLELMRSDAIVAIQDMGAAGLTSSSCEMAAKGGVGIEIEIDRVPRREDGMTAYETMLSESQERMLMVVRPGAEAEVRRIFDRWRVASAVIGRVTDSQHLVVRSEGGEVARLPTSLLSDDAPEYDRPTAVPRGLAERWVEPELAPCSAESRLLALLRRPTIASKRWVYDQYDWSVRLGTVVGPGEADAAVIRLPGPDLSPASGRRGVAMTVDVNSRYVDLDPRRGAALGVLEAARNLVCVGAEPKAVSDCLNFGNPEKPEVMWSFAEAVRGLEDACRALDTPIVSGNVSLYNETEGRPILPTPTVAMVGIVEDVGRVATSAFAREGDTVLLLGWVGGLSLGGSELVLMESGTLQGRPAEPWFERARAVHDTCRNVVRRGLVNSAHDVSEGGLLVAIAESCILGGLGASVRLPAEVPAVRAAFGEGPNVIVLSAEEHAIRDIEEEAARHDAPVIRMGVVQGTSLTVEGQLDVSVARLSEAWEGALPRNLKGETTG